jgi:hypothetical protein
MAFVFPSICFSKSAGSSLVTKRNSTAMCTGEYNTSYGHIGRGLTSELLEEHFELVRGSTCWIETISVLHRGRGNMRLGRTIEIRRRNDVVSRSRDGCDGHELRRLATGDR